jgi:hypothetical protein
MSRRSSAVLPEGDGSCQVVAPVLLLLLLLLGLRCTGQLVNQQVVCLPG